VKKNPVLSRELAPLVVACSNIFMQSHTNTHNKMAAEIADLNQKLSFYSQSFDSMGATQRAWEPVAQHAPVPTQAAQMQMQMQMQPAVAQQHQFSHSMPTQHAAPIAVAASAAGSASAAFDDATNAAHNLQKAFGSFNATGITNERMPVDMLPRSMTGGLRH